jgi:hypothetical protein
MFSQCANYVGSFFSFNPKGLNFKTLHFVTGLFFLIIGCSEPKQPEPIIYSVPEKLEPIVLRFVTIAENDYQIDLPKDNLIITLHDQVLAEETPVCARAEGPLLAINQRRVFLDTNCVFYQSDSIALEILIFHELGHAWLDREHDNSLRTDGRKKSLMHSAPWNPFNDFYLQDLTLRDYYLDELFGKNSDKEDSLKYSFDKNIKGHTKDHHTQIIH